MTEESSTKTTTTTDERSIWQKAEGAFTGKQASQFFDPCQEAASRSIKCLHRNQGDKTMCTDYFQAYRDCKKEWANERKEDDQEDQRLAEPHSKLA